MGSLHRGGPGDTYSQLGEVQPTPRWRCPQTRRASEAFGAGASWEPWERVSWVEWGWGAFGSEPARGRCVWRVSPRVRKSRT